MPRGHVGCLFVTLLTLASCVLEHDQLTVASLASAEDIPPKAPGDALVLSCAPSSAETDIYPNVSGSQQAADLWNSLRAGQDLPNLCFWGPMTQSAAQLEIWRASQIPPSVVTAVDRVSRSSFFSHHLTDLPEYAHLRGLRDRNGNLYDTLPGVGMYSAGGGAALNPQRERTGDGHGSVSLLLHEYGHTVDACFNQTCVDGALSSQPEWRDGPFTEAAHEIGPESAYPGEWFAESFAMYTLSNYSFWLLHDKYPLTWTYFNTRFGNPRFTRHDYTPPTAPDFIDAQWTGSTIRVDFGSYATDDRSVFGHQISRWDGSRWTVLAILRRGWSLNDGGIAPERRPQYEIRAIDWEGNLGPARQAWLRLPRTQVLETHNPTTFDSLLTTHYDEYQLTRSWGWWDAGRIGGIYDGAPGLVTVYRVYNGRDHFWTTSYSEYQYALGHGYHHESTMQAWNAPGPGRSPVWRSWCSTKQTHVFTRWENWRDDMNRWGPCSTEGIAFYVGP